ncbi:MAG TPA: hypothetical protein VK631_15490 [Solirubrobacteraceae bacterium]|nr:hypothetical protein [Solirubrobacteraceae bacterium]
MPSVLRILIVLVLDTIVLFPVDLPYPEDGVVGPDSMHRVLRGWLAHVG